MLYHYDGLGSTRALSNGAGDITDTYNYEAFGELLNSTGSSENSYLFAGEQYDAETENYYLRARYLDPSIGRFTQQDSWMGNNYDPITLHKYLYANADAGNMIDPTGNFSIGSMMSAVNVVGTLAGRAQFVYDVFQFASGEKEFSAKELGMVILFNHLPVKMVQRLLRKSCSPNSFTEDTLVSTEDGLKRIADIKIGDMVWAFNEETGEKSLQEVVHLIHGEGDKEIVDITLMSGEVIQATSGHPFYVNNADGQWGWLDAGDLVSGSTLTNLNGDELKVASVEKYLKPLSVFNLTVDNDHTYYVGESQVLNHNVQTRCPINGLLFGQKKPKYEINDKHVGGKRSGGKPSSLHIVDADIAFSRAIKAESDPKKWYAKSSDGKSIYMYTEDTKKGVAHLSANTSDVKSALRWNNIPDPVKFALGFDKKGKRK